MFNYLDCTTEEQEKVAQKVPFSFDGEGKQYSFDELIKEIKKNPLKFITAVMDDQLSLQLPFGFLRVPKMYVASSHLKVHYLNSGGEENPFMYYSIDQPGTVETYEDLMVLSDYTPIYDEFTHAEMMQKFSNIEIETNERTGSY